MADPVEDKDSLAERLEEDRARMAIQVSELKEDYNVPHRWRESVQKFPWPWIIGAVLTGFLLSRLPAPTKRSLPVVRSSAARSATAGTASYLGKGWGRRQKQGLVLC